jgi:hypothetical protein
MITNSGAVMVPLEEKLIEKGSQPKTLEAQYKPIADRMILQGCTLQEMADSVGNTNRQTMSLYIKRSGQYDTWREKSEEKQAEQKRKKGIEKQITGILKQLMVKSAYQKSWAEGKTEEYLQSIKYYPGPNAVPRDTILKIMEAYQRAKESGQNISFADIGKLVGQKGAGARHILNKVNLASLNYSLPYKPRNVIDTRLFVELKNLGFHLADVAYFCGTTHSLVRQRLQSAGLESNEGKSIKRFRRRGMLTYKLASQIYEAEDLGFKGEEIAQVLNTYMDLVNFALAKKEEIAPKIVQIIEKVQRAKTNLPYKIQKPVL